MSIVPESRQDGQWVRKSIFINSLCVVWGRAPRPSSRAKLGNGRTRYTQRFLANANSNAAPAAIPATASPVRFMDFSMATR